ncbi:IclR family transcriptional regulator C-terminal domain-containing protein [Streptomyces sp. DSM 41014]|uniref:IclR family transcriptional regulator C-terminal domain-containing protein n=1 Tax=Streptomyces hintoniae TaxID=3075521 RepID=A0ABU2UR86_9ACTN|nr:IclR family transcriptional regulator C-terminal domain-containing protein [Streptomyces sp. DSM 41014]MDT0475585.1 IclR family transcriptional regulator C-terminal domain-containing protein [Streptomyces sp. DSM 41014]
MALRNEPTAPYRSAQDALRVLEAVARHTTGVTESEVARHTGLGQERVVGLVRMLRREGYVEQVADGAYVTGAAFGGLGAARGGGEAVRDDLQRTLDRLRDSVGAAVYLSRYVDGEARITQYADGPTTPAVNEWVDFRFCAHATAVGKSLLGQLGPEARRDHLARHRPARLTSRTITSDALLLSRLADRPPTVPHLDLQEYAVGTVCAAVPITAGSSVGSLGLSLPVEEVHRLREAAQALNRGAAGLLLSLAIRPY